MTGSDNVWTVDFAIGELTGFSQWQTVGGGGRNAPTVAHRLPSYKPLPFALQPDPASAQQADRHGHVVYPLFQLRHGSTVKAFPEPQKPTSRTHTDGVR